MASHVHLPTMPEFSEHVRRNADGTYDYSELDEVFSDWREKYDATIDRHNAAMKKPWYFRATTGYKNPEPLPHVPSPGVDHD